LSTAARALQARLGAHLFKTTAMALACLLPVTLAFSRTPHCSGARSQQRATLSMLGEGKTLDGTKTEVDWITSPSGYKYIEERVGNGVKPGAGEVVQIHYTVSLLSSGTTLGTSRGGDGQGPDRPLTMAVGKHDVPIWDEALSGMRVGGKRRMLLPPDALPEFQADKVPGENRELRFDFELLDTVHPWAPLAKLAGVLPPHKRPRMPRNVSNAQAFLFVWLLSFVPYFMPVDLQPQAYHDGKPLEQIHAERETHAKALANARFLGGDVEALDSLFP